MVTVRDGIYLEQNPPARSQFRVGRRALIKPVIVVHTAQSGTDKAGPDPKAENVARFIRDRTGPGSYHLLGDADSIIQLVDFENEAFQDGTGSNRWAIGISLAMNAADWTTLPIPRASQLLDTAVQMAAIAAHWLHDNGHGLPMAVRLTKAESDRANASGFIDHARRDLARRTDPGTGFPWPEFFKRYQETINRELQEDQMTHLEQYQQHLLDAGYPIRKSEPLDQPDNDFGPTMLETSLKVLAGVTAKPAPPTSEYLELINAKAAKWDRHVQATRDVLDEAGR